MARVRRTRYLVVCCQDSTVPDIAALLCGVARVVSVEDTYAISILRGEKHIIAPDEVQLLLSVPSNRWVDGDGMDRAALDRLVRIGLLLADDEEPAHTELVRRDSQLQAGEWNVFGALYHFLTRWRDVNTDVPFDEPDLGELTVAMGDAVDDFVARHGPAPPAFRVLPEPLAMQELPLVGRRGGLHRALAARRTTRAFDRGATMSMEELATVLYSVFGCHALAPMADGGIMIKRTSPSAGGLHPIEAYPLVTGVEDIAPGLYHYNVRDHALELIAELTDAEAARTANEFLCGQIYFASAHVKVVLTARFYRSFWKYRRHPKAYAALMMDAGHLSQTMYLVAAELGLGAFVTAAVNGANIEERLGIDGTTEGVLAVCGCGVPSPNRSPLEPEFAPYVPRWTPLRRTGADSGRESPTPPRPGPAGSTTEG